MIPFTKREAAFRAFTLAMAAPRRVLGLDPTEVLTERLTRLRNAKPVVALALEGPARQFMGEPSDDELNSYTSRLNAAIDGVQDRLSAIA